MYSLLLLLFPGARPRSLVCVPPLAALLLTLLLMPLVPARAQTVPGLPHWQWQSPHPTGYSLTDLVPLTDTSAVVIGYHGTALKTTDRGRTWQPLPTGTDRLLNTHCAAFAPDNQTGWVFPRAALTNLNTQAYDAGPGEVRRTTTGGRTWTRQAIGEPQSTIPLAVAAVSPTEAYALYQYSFQSSGGGTQFPTPRLRHTTNGGATWQMRSVPASSIFFLNGGGYFRFFSSLVGYLAIPPGAALGVPPGAVYKTTDGAQTWQSIAPDPTREYGQLYFLNVRQGWLSSPADTALYHTANGGQSWQQLPRIQIFGVDELLRDVVFADTLHGYGLSQYTNQFVRTDDGGQSWYQPLGANAVFRYYPIGVRALGTTVWVFGQAGTLWYSGDRGQMWAQRDERVGVVVSIDAPDPTRAWAASDSSVLRCTRPEGPWQSVSVRGVPQLNLTNGNGFRVIHAAFPDRDTGFVAIENWLLPGVPRLLVARTPDAGRTWAAGVAPVNPALFTQHLATKLFFRDTRRGLVIGEGGQIALTQDGAQTWQAVPSGTTRTLRVVVWADAQTVYACGDSNTVVKSTNGGLSWLPVTPPGLALGLPLTVMTFSSPTVGYVGNAISYFQRTTDGGQTWGPVSWNLPNLYPQDGVGFGITGSDPVALRVGPGRRVWVLGRNSFRSDDGGAMWPLAAKTELEYATAADPVDAYNAWVIGPYGRIMHYSEKYIQTDTTATQRRAYCTGDTATVAFDTTGLFSSTERNFRVELSNKMGRFRPNETTILPLLGAASASPLRARLPASLVAGTRYRVRVIRADSSVLGGDNERDLTIYPRPAAVAVAPLDSARFCAGDSVLLTAPAGYAAYAWSGGASTAAIWVATAGTYAVRVAQGGGCFGPASRPVTVRVTPRPVAPGLSQSQSGSGPAQLTAAPALPGGTYVWTGPNGVVAGITGPTLLLTGAAQNGPYTVSVTARGCASPPSNSVNVIITGLAAAATDPGLTLHPNPADGSVVLMSARVVRAVMVRDLAGRQVSHMAGAEVGMEAGTAVRLALGSVPAGSYLVEVTLADGWVLTRRLLVAH